MSKPALLNADTEWNTPHQMPWRGLVATPVARNAMASTTAPTTSAPSANSATLRTTPSTPPRRSSPVVCWTAMRSARPTRRRPPRSRSRSVEPAMIPKPPAWTSNRMTICPNALQCWDVTTTVRPVTHTADVAVNSASSGEVRERSWLEMGSISNAVPMAMSARNP